MYALEWGVYAGVQDGIGSAQHGRGRIDTVPQDASTYSAGSQCKHYSSTRAHQPSDQRPIACARHLRIVIAFEQHVQRVGACDCAESSSREEQQGQAA